MDGTGGPTADAERGDTTPEWRASYVEGRKDPFTDDQRTNRTRLRLMGVDRLSAGARVLDVGAGDGNLAASLVAMGLTGVVGVEYQPELLALHPHRDRTAAGSAEALPLPDGSMDAVVVMDVLHHLQPAQLPGAVDELHRVLRPGGTLFVCEPAQTPVRRALMVPLRSPLHRLTAYTRAKRTIVDAEGETYEQWLAAERGFPTVLAAAGFAEELLVRRWLHFFGRWVRP